MARRKHGVDLFEVLTERKTPVSLQTPDTAAAQPERPRSAAQPDRELVFGTDTGFVIFAAVLILIGSAYYLGYQSGVTEARQRIAPTEGDVPQKTGITPLKTGGGNETSTTALYVPEEMYTLKLFLTRDVSKNELKLLRLDRAYVLQLESVLQEGIQEAYLFRNKKNKIYALGLGLFDTANDAKIARLRDSMRSAKGPPHRNGTPYDGCSVEQVKELGTPVP